MDEQQLDKKIEDTLHLKDEGAFVRGTFNRLLLILQRLQEDQSREVGKTLIEVLHRIDQDNRRVKKRIETPEYLSLVRKSFRSWSLIDNERKRAMIRNLLVNAASIKLSPDSVLRMFINWVHKYSDEHFAVIWQAYLHPGISRKEIWLNLHKEIPSEDSAEADLFKLIVLDLSSGHIIRQSREKDYHGRFVKKKMASKEKDESFYKLGPQPFISAFDNERVYELTELGKQFVRYSMQERAH